MPGVKHEGGSGFASPERRLSNTCMFIDDWWLVYNTIILTGMIR